MGNETETVKTRILNKVFSSVFSVGYPDLMKTGGYNSRSVLITTMIRTIVRMQILFLKD